MSSPSFLTKVGFIRRWFSIKCETPWVIYFETGGKALLKAMLSLLDFGFDDIVRAFWRPKGLRSGRHGRKRRRRRKGGAAAMPEIGEEIAKHLPGAKEVKGRKTSHGVKVMWEIDGLGQRAMYYWMIADVVTDFAFDWLAGIAADPHSKCDNLARGYAEASNVPMNGRDNWIAVPHGITRYEHWPVDMNSQLISLGSGHFFIIHKANVFNDQPNPATVQLAVVRGGAEWDWIGVSGREEISPFGKTDLIASADVEGPGTIILMMWSDHFVNFEHTSATAFGGENITKEGL